MNLTKKQSQKNSPIYNAKHYTCLNPQPIDVVAAWDLDFYIGSVLQYIGRARYKGQEIDDYKKAIFYLEKKIEILENAKRRNSK